MLRIIIGLVFMVSFSRLALAASYEEWERKYVFTENWFPAAHASNWQKHLSIYVGRPNTKYLEVGVWEGRSLLWALDHVLTGSGSRAVAVDTFPSKIEKTFKNNLQKSGQSRRVDVVVGDSQEVLRKYDSGPFDIIYIDGAHNMKTVLLDAINSWYLLKEEGVLIFDDYNMSGDFPIDLHPRLAIDTFLTAFRHEVEVLEKGAQVFLRKKANVSGTCHYCSRFGGYTYDWYARQLYIGTWYTRLIPGSIKHNPSVLKKVSLIESEKKILEELLRRQTLGQTELAIDSPEFERDSAKLLFKKLKISKQDFLISGNTVSR